MNFLIMQTKNQNPEKEIKILSPREVKKGDKLYIIRRAKSFYIGKIRR